MLAVRLPLPRSPPICFLQSRFRVTSCICARPTDRSLSAADKHKAAPRASSLPAPEMGIDTSPLFSEHEVILLMACQVCTPKFDSAAALKKRAKKKKKKRSPTIYYAVCASPRCLSSAIYFLPWGTESHFSPIFSGSLRFLSFSSHFSILPRC